MENRSLRPHVIAMSVGSKVEQKLIQCTGIFCEKIVGNVIYLCLKVFIIGDQKNPSNT